MTNKVPVKFYHWNMLEAPEIIPAQWQTKSIVNTLSSCLVTGFNEQTPLSGQITDGVCRIHVTDNKSFSTHTTVLISGATQSELNGEHVVTNHTGSWFEIKTTLGNNAVDVSGMTVKYAPAGWEHVFQKTNTKAVYRSTNTDPDSRRLCLRIIDTDYQKAKANMFYQMGNIDDVDFIFKNEQTWQYIYRNYSNLSNKIAWFIVASDTFFYFINSFYGDEYTTYRIFHFGDTKQAYPKDKGNTLLKSHNENYHSFSRFEYGHAALDAGKEQTAFYLAGSYVDHKSPIKASATPDIAASSLSSNTFYPSGKSPGFIRDPLTNKTPIYPYKVFDHNNHYRGIVPGMYFVRAPLFGVYEQGAVVIDEETQRKYLAIYPAWTGNRTFYTDSGSFVFIDIQGPW